MKRLFVLLLAVLAGALAWLTAQVTLAAPPPLASLFPAGPALYLQARDLAALLRDWNRANEKALWLASDQYRVFSRSNLFLKLASAQDEFAAAAGVPPNMALVENVAGSESALAIYDIGELRFLFITRLPESQISQSSLWKARGTYEPRQSAGLDYYTHFDKASKRVAAFASARGYLILATREDLVAGALALIAGQAAAPLSSEPWFVQAGAAAPQSGELRLALNMPLLLRSPYMRSYWIQRNAGELKQYASAVSDLTRSAGEIRETRQLIRLAEQSPAWNEGAVAQISRLAPLDAGLSRAWASPTAEQAMALILDKILAPSNGAFSAGPAAPSAASPDSIAGSEADLEVRIDEPPFEAAAGTAPQALQALLSAEPVQAMMHIAASRVLADGVFVGVDSAVVLLRASDWNAAAARSALEAAGLLSKGPLPMAVETQGPLLIVSTQPELARAVLAGSVRPPSAAGARYAAFYRHSRELPNFLKMTQLIDYPLRAPDSPMFFSQTVGSLGASLLGRLDWAMISVHDSGAAVTQNLTYKLRP